MTEKRNELATFLQELFQFLNLLDAAIHDDNNMITMLSFMHSVYVSPLHQAHMPDAVRGAAMNLTKMVPS